MPWEPRRQLPRRLLNSGADFVFGLKGNQSKLHEAVANYVVEQWEDEFVKRTFRRSGGEYLGGFGGRFSDHSWSASVPGDG